MLFLIASCGEESAFASDETNDELAVQPDPHFIAELERQVSAIPPASQTNEEKCAFYQSRGVANFRLGRYPAAIADLTQAEASIGYWQTNTAPCSRDIIRDALISAYEESGDFVADIEYLKRTLDKLSASDLTRHLFIDTGLAHAQLDLGRLPEANASLESAKGLLLRLRHSSRIVTLEASAAIHGVDARLQMTEGNYRAGVELARQEVDIRREILHAQSELYVPNSEAALEGRRYVAIAEARLAYALISTGKLGEAGHFARLSYVEVATLSGFGSNRTVSALKLLAIIRLREGHIKQAEQLFDRALQAADRAKIVPYSLGLAELRAWKGLVLNMQGRWAKSAEIFRQRDTGMRESEEQFSRFGARHSEWALALLNLGKSAQAEGMLRHQITGAERLPRPDPADIAVFRGYLGNTLSAQGKSEAALAQYRLALPELVKPWRYGGGDDGKDAAIGYVQQYKLRVIVEGYLELLARMARSGETPAGIDVAGETFGLADTVRNGLVQRAITASTARTSLPNSQLAGLARREQDAANRAQSLGSLLERVSLMPNKQTDDATINALEREVRLAQEQQAALAKEITARFPTYAELVAPRATAISDVRRLLRPDEAVVAFFVGARQTYVWTLEGDTSRFRAIPISRERLLQQVESLRHSVDLSDGTLKRFDVAAAQQLYSSLLAPDGALWATARTLIVIPDGPLAQIPLGLLLTGRDGDVTDGSQGIDANRPWLIKRVAISEFSSANVLLALRTASTKAAERRPFLGFGDPVFAAQPPAGERTTRGLSVRDLVVAPAAADTDTAPASARPSGVPLVEAFSHLPPLPDTGEELRDIARSTGADLQRDLFLGVRATVGNVKAAELSRYRVVAFATHSLAPGEVTGLDEPALAMSNPALVSDPGSNGFLSIDDILSLTLDADWVVLSACNTGKHDDENGESASGLERAFFYAGARGILVSNWAVETVSARLLTTTLFRNQAADHRMSRAQALRQAMLEVMRTPGEKYGHPAFWAAFSLVGDGRD
ncbi:CHAT domain-containing protein [Paraburkholderia sp. UYCP14C]|uniref:CHAT domain-containing protein n=1 Tax=Paraburkholderia sp. UYCP14C TaxID=2511130 RepID=UPI0010213A6D|nr:CHAT domain-containing protein [Paraburkholderia sp. UYCP14C]RZF27282.1 CHAT domain-containing protein [Paraburkholderia sp. UYCP14C]